MLMFQINLHFFGCHVFHSMWDTFELLIILLVKNIFKVGPTSVPLYCIARPQGFFCK